MSQYRANIERRDQPGRRPWVFYTEQICTKRWLKKKWMFKSTYIVTHVHQKCRYARIEHWEWSPLYRVSRRGEGMLLNSTDPPYVSHNGSAGSLLLYFCISYAPPHHSNVNLIGVTSWEVFKSLLQKQKSCAGVFMFLWRSYNDDVLQEHLNVRRW